MNGLVWCQAHQINTANFYAWRRKLNEPQRQQGCIELHSSTDEYASIRICLGTTLPVEMVIPSVAVNFMWASMR
jgi:hypothetical protein